MPWNKKIPLILSWALSPACPHPLIKQWSHTHKHWQLPALFFLEGLKGLCLPELWSLGPLLLQIYTKMQLPAWNTLSWGLPGQAQLLRLIWNGIRTHSRGGRGTEKSLLIGLSPSLLRATGLGADDNPVDLFLLLEVWKTEPQQDSRWNLEAAPQLRARTSTLHSPQSPSSPIHSNQLLFPHQQCSPSHLINKSISAVPTWF